MTGTSKPTKSAAAPAPDERHGTESLEDRVARLRLEVEALELEHRRRVLSARGAGGGGTIKF